MIQVGFSSISNTVHVKIKASSEIVGTQIIGAALVQEAIEVKVLKHIRILERTEIKIEGLAVSEVIEVARRLVRGRHLLYRL